MPLQFAYNSSNVPFFSSFPSERCCFPLANTERNFQSVSKKHISASKPADIFPFPPKPKASATFDVTNGRIFSGACPRPISSLTISKFPVTPPHRNPISVNFQRFPTLDAKKLVNAPKMSAHHRGICHF